MSERQPLQVRHEHPPNIDLIDAKFHVKEQKGIIYAFAPDIYNPDGKMVPVWLVKHEMVHLERQGTEPHKWWAEYIESAAFRLEEELLAHRVEYATFCSIHRDRNTQAKYHAHIAQKLSSRTYGRMITYTDALKEIAR